MVSWRKARSPRAPIPGMEMTVSAEVSVATIESRIAQAGRSRAPRK
jgi:hypothetical protein